jgi:hypothetical protein
MATASDAKGVLPRWVQAKAVPGQIARDVQLFIRWIAKEREQQGGKAGTTAGRVEDTSHGHETNDHKKADTATTQREAPAGGESNGNT